MIGAGNSVVKNTQYTTYSIHGAEKIVVGTVLDLLLEIRGLVHKRRRLPPQSVLNLILSRGEWDGGMSGGCQWSPFQIDAAEFLMLEQLAKDADWEIPDYPSWIETAEHFSIWQYDADFGIPWEEHKRLSDIAAATEGALKDAIDSNQAEDTVLRLHLENVSAQQRVADYFDHHIEKYDNR